MEISQNYVPNPQEEFQSPKKKARYVDESKNHPNQQADNATDLETPNADDGDTAYRSPTSKNKTPTKATKASPKKKAVTPKTHAADSGPKGIDGSKFVITGMGYIQCLFPISAICQCPNPIPRESNSKMYYEYFRKYGESNDTDGKS